MIGNLTGSGIKEMHFRMCLGRVLQKRITHCSEQNFQQKMQPLSKDGPDMKRSEEKV